VGCVAKLDDRKAAAALRSGIPDVDRHLSEGALEIIASPEWYLKDGKSDAGRVIQSWQDRLDAHWRAGMAACGSTATKTG
jgi:hypothetical protein